MIIHVQKAKREAQTSYKFPSYFRRLPRLFFQLSHLFSPFSPCIFTKSTRDNHHFYKDFGE